jgi:hypothetical protein
MVTTQFKRKAIDPEKGGCEIGFLLAGLGFEGVARLDFCWLDLE